MDSVAAITSGSSSWLMRSQHCDRLVGSLGGTTGFGVASSLCKRYDFVSSEASLTVDGDRDDAIELSVSM